MTACRIVSFRLVALVLWSFILGVLTPTSAQVIEVPQYEVDPYWPKMPLGDQWITGGLGGMCVDNRDHVFILNRGNVDLIDLDGARPAPPVIEFDPEGRVVRAWGDRNLLGDRLHDCHVDSDGSVWIIGSGAGFVQKYSSDGTAILLQIGESGLFDSSDGTRDGHPLNSDRAQFFFPAAIDVDGETGDIYVADGESPGGNSRIAVFDHQGRFLRQWRLNRTESDVDLTPVPHCLRLANDGLVYVCDRRADRIQVFDRMGTFVRDIDVPWESKSPSDGRPSGTRGSAVVVALSPDPEQRLLFVSNQNAVEINVIDRQTGKLLSRFGGGPGRYLGQFTLPHGIDSAGSVYVAEQEGRRIQRFRVIDP